MSLKTLFLLFMMGTSVSSQAQEMVIANGIAFDKKGKVVYKEFHKMQVSKTQKIIQIQTIYKNSSDKEFGRLLSKFDNHPYIPSFNFEDTRFKKVEGIEWVDKTQFKAFAKKNKDSKLKEKVFKPEDKMVAGQGLYAFVYANLKNIVEQKQNIQLKYLLPIRQDDYSLRLRMLDYDKDSDIVTLRLEFSSWFMRLLAPNIDLKYRYKTRQLLQYSGTSNLLSDKGEDQNVVIKYTYPQELNKSE